MMRIGKFVLLCVAACALIAHSAPVDTAAVRAAAGAWASRGTALGTRLGSRVESVSAHAVTNGYSFYAVRLAGGGTVFFSSDTELEPVIAFTSNPNVNLSDERSPLLQLLRRDIIARAAIRDLKLKNLGAGASGLGVSPDEANVQKWAAFGVATRTAAPTAQGERSRMTAVVTSATTTSAAPPVQIVDDVCVSPHLSTKWNQTADASGMPCFNYYMWSELGGGVSSTDDWPCGCTATAMSQILRYFRYPNDEQEEKTYTCQVNGIAVELRTKPGVFNWDKMVDWPDGTYTMTEDQREAIGRLTWNAAVSLGSAFTSSLGSANPKRLAKTLRQSFAYTNAWVYWDDTMWNSGKGGLHDRATRERIVHANLDAGRPVLFAIYGYPKAYLYNDNYWAGHAVVGDGYGYQSVDGEKTAYVHVNMGWGGTDDVWYNIPEIDAANSGAHVGESGYDFLYMGGAAFNIAPTIDEYGEILSGRILDDRGSPLADAVVSVYDADGVLLTTTTSSETGIYSFILPGGRTYTVSARSADGRKVADPLKDIELNLTIGSQEGIVSSEQDVGNSCGNDFVLMEPTVRVGMQVFGSLNAALSSVKSSSVTDAVVEIIAPTELRESVDVDFSCTIHSTASNPRTTLITRSPGATLSVLDGGHIDFKDVAFASDATGEVTVSVATGGAISVEGTIGLGRVVSESASGFILTGALTPVEGGIVIGAANETTVRGAAFGRYTCSYEVASENAAKVVKFGDDEFGGLANEDGFLVWERVPVDPSAALAVATNDEFGTTYYRSLDQLFADYRNGGDVVILKDCATNSFTVPLTIRKPLTIRSADEARTIVPFSTACFTIADGGSLTVSNLTISGYVGSRLFSVLGGSLTLSNGATLSNLMGLGVSDDDGGGDECGVIRLTRGTVTMLPGSAIRNCRVSTEGGGLGGGLAAIGGTLNLFGGSITGCSAGGKGGGVWNFGATVNLAGDIQIQGNVNETGSDDNLYMARSTAVQITAPLVGAKVGVCAASTSANAIGKSFAVFGANLTDSEGRLAAEAFTCDAKPDFYAVPSGSTLVWGERVNDGSCDEADAVVRVTDANGMTRFYDSVSTAFAALSGDATVAILQDTVFTNNLTIASRVQLVSAGDVVRTLTRNLRGASGVARMVVSAGGSLSVANLTLSGNNLMDSSGHAMLEVFGSLTLDSGASVVQVRSEGMDGTAAVGAITVLSGGVLTMKPGSLISDCTSLSDDELDECGAGIYLVGGTAYLQGGSVSNCKATGIAGILAVNKSKVYLSDGVSVQGNTWQNYPDRRSNFSVSKNSELILAGEVTGQIGYTEAVSCSTTAFARVPDWTSWKMSALTNSAAHFRHDLTGERGVVVTNASSAAVFVWKSALASDGSYKDDESADGATYWAAAIPEFAVDPVVVPCQPFSVIDIECVSEGVWRLTLNPGVEACTYLLYGSDDLGATQDAASLKAKKTLKAADVDSAGNFTFDIVSPGVRQFWRVFGEDGEKTTP